MKKFIGIDLHSKNTVVVVSDEEDRVLFQKRMANDLKQIELALAPHRDDQRRGDGQSLSPVVLVDGFPGRVALDGHGGDVQQSAQLAGTPFAQSTSTAVLAGILKARTRLLFPA